MKKVKLNILVKAAIVLAILAFSLMDLGSVEAKDLKKCNDIYDEVAGDSLCYDSDADRLELDIDGITRFSVEDGMIDLSGMSGDPTLKINEDHRLEISQGDTNAFTFSRKGNWFNLDLSPDNNPSGIRWNNDFGMFQISSPQNPLAVWTEEGMSMWRDSNAADDSKTLDFARSREVANAVLNGDRLGQITFSGNTSFNNPVIGAFIRATADGEPGVGDVPTNLLFSAKDFTFNNGTNDILNLSDGLLDLSGMTVNWPTIKFSDIGFMNYSDAEEKGGAGFEFARTNGYLKIMFRTWPDGPPMNEFHMRQDGMTIATPGISFAVGNEVEFGSTFGIYHQEFEGTDQIQLYFDGYPGTENGRLIYNPSGDDFKFMQGSTELLKISDDGVVVPVKTSTPACEEGAIYYNSGDSHFYGCDGSSWKQLDN
jgi:hypothetical protein